MIDAKSVAELRAKTGAGMMDCKKALTETNGNMEAAIDYLREKGIAKAAKKESRIAAEGLANVYIDGNKAVILEVNSETDFVSKNEEFTSMLDTIGEAILKSDATTIEEALTLPTDEGTVNDLIVAKTAKIGEKLSLRRFSKVTKTDEENFGAYIHMGGKIAVLTVIKGADETVAKGACIYAEWADCKGVLMSEPEVYGGYRWASSPYDSHMQHLQLPLFRHRSIHEIIYADIWLKDVASVPYACHVSWHGHIGASAASLASRVCPLFLIA